ncbi:carboxypeptidase-like regulatory domain-containing protein [Aestuariivivens insulae]|uniref:carboxypeptidase-like regulatory domain-containing protein n=1 Tax=Aestuariivivens insulae TaxID=1621988 RepID=UPI001F598A9A|nr:carboxypeptidase-like regulatory domain-containing protein [Aestuariivivens insulae]
MLKNRAFFLIVVMFGVPKIYAQSVEILGKVIGDKDVENIHVINKTAQLFAVTNKDGVFKITASLNDTLVFSSVQYKVHNLNITNAIILTKTCIVKLEEQVNELDEVLVGKVLTGNLASDIKNIDGKPPINFYDVGIPGYTGKQATQSERRLAEAGDFKPKMLMGLLGGGLPLNPILNGISGRTKMLKRRVDIEHREDLMQSIKSRLAKDFFASNPLDDNLKMDFFYFCADDENFIKRCKNQTDFKVLAFLRMKYRQYQANRNISED